MLSATRIIQLIIVLLPALLLPGRLGLAGEEPRAAPIEAAAQPVQAGITCPKGVLVHGTNQVKVSLENTSPAAITGTVALTLPDGWSCEPADAPFTLQAAAQPAGTKADVQFQVKTSLTDSPGQYGLGVVVDDKAARKTLGPFPLTLTSPLGDLAGIGLAEVYSSAPSMAVPVSNPLAEPVSASVGLSAGDWVITPDWLPLALGPGEERLLRFVVEGRLPVVGPLPVTVTIAQRDRVVKLRRTVDISRYRAHGWAIGKPEVQALRFDGRRLSYDLPKMTVVSVRIYDAKGRIARVLDSGWQSAGPHKYEWTPEGEVDDLDQRVAWLAEVRAGLDLVFDHQIAPAPGTIFYPRAVAVHSSGVVYAFEGTRAMKFTAQGDYAGSDIPGAGWAGIAPVEAPVKAPVEAPRKDTPENPQRGVPTYAVLKGGRLLLLSRVGAMIKAIPREAGGTQPGQFRDPTSLAISHDGLVYVADTSNHRVQRFDSQLEPVPFPQTTVNCVGKTEADGTPAAGPANGEFILPSQIAVNPQGQFYVLDATGRLQRFDPSGKHVQTINLLGKDAGEGARAVFAIGPDGAIFVARAGARTIAKLDSNGNPLWAGGSVPIDASEVLAMAADAIGRLFVCGQNPSRVSILDSATGQPLGVLGPKPAPGVPASPAGIDVDDQGNLCVADLRAQQVVRLDAAGKLLWAAPDARMPMKMYHPLDVALAAAGIYVLDEYSGGKGVVMLDLWGEPKWDFNNSYLLQENNLKKATTVELDEQGKIWAGSAGRGTLYSSAGAVLFRNVPQPRTKASAGGILYLPWEEESKRGVILKDVRNREIARKGTLGTAEGEFSGCEPGGIAAATGAPGKPDFVYYADHFNHRIIVLRAEWASSAAAGK